MTPNPASVALRSEPGVVPVADTLVLLDRPLDPQSRRPVSVFGDDWWDLSQGMFEAHISDVRLNFSTVPDRFRPAAKHYVWQLINRDHPGHGTRRRRLALRSIAQGMPRLATFLHWLDSRNVARIADVTDADLDDYATDVAKLEASANTRAGLLLEVRRLWAYRLLLPEDVQLPQPPPWNGDPPSELLGGAKRPRENSTARIGAATMEPLLMWALRFVEDFADDIITAYHEYLRLRGRSASLRHRSAGYTGDFTSPQQAKAAVRAWLCHLKQAGRGLPSRQPHHGELQVDWPHLCQLFDVSADAFRTGRPLRRIVDAAGLPLGGPALLDTPISGKLHGRPWLSTPIRYGQAGELARLLCTAATVVIAYLTGMRPGEVLNLERGCIRCEPATGLWSISGKHWKSARDHHGNKIAQGQQRPDPWTTIEPVAHAIALLERLHPHTLLFTAHMHPVHSYHEPSAVPRQRRVTRLGKGRTTAELTHDLTALTGWINTYARHHDLHAEQIPPDPHGAITLTRFRRTLAWHIVRRPRGLIAGAIQYGHLHVQLTLGYAGTYDSGFPDEHAYEDWLLRLDTLADNHRRLTEGEAVSGPAADNYRNRITAAQHAFAGRVLTSPRHARDLVTNPLLQIFPGRGMTCVFDPAKALCQLHPAEDDIRRTPDHDDCRPTCRNIAHTDRDIAAVRHRAAQLHNIASDYLAPPIRHHRERAELDRLTAIIRRHDHGK
ncbi:hypothetical protein [Micromonospora sp. WMMD1082]|uniref:hypothetical protein n=1 Tax=Micromonospora sp. WMMD1082 TaxID=3016104 RepID=UPI00241770D2|nr:hypothetical protein [Micromonospora sp. WMMD1082]MDG4795453.1 hypothetical protein [Micromonospora sp. WMMD1082]